jgi:hypothetical protein
LRSLARVGLAVFLALSALSVTARGDERSEAESKLEKAISAKDGEAAKNALAAATNPGDERAAKLIVTHAVRLKGIAPHEALLAAIARIKDDAGVHELAEQAQKSSSAELRFLLVEGLAAQGSPRAEKAVLDALDDKEDLVSTCAARSTRRFASPEAIDRLIARLEKAEPKPQEATLARELLGALSTITGESLSFALEWKGWWLQHKEGFKPKAASDAPAGGEGGTTVVDRLRQNRPEDAHTIERLKDDDVIVVRGKSDKISDVLKAIKIAHKEISPEEVSKTKLSPGSVLVLNCNSRENPYSDSEFAQIREFVEKGGYLFTSDWQLEFLLAKAFPRSVELDKKYYPETKGEAMTVTIVPAAPRHPLLRDVFPATSWDALGFTWKIDSNSEFPKILSPEVTVLVTSPECKQKLQNDAVALVFRWSKGKVVPYAPPASSRQATGGAGGAAAVTAPEGGLVLHVLGHFKHQKDKDAGDHFALQQLLLNFILEKQRLAKHGG